jgi:cytochrome c oxidase subunit IV
MRGVTAFRWSAVVVSLILKAGVAHASFCRKMIQNSALCASGVVGSLYSWVGHVSFAEEFALVAVVPGWDQ